MTLDPRSNPIGHQPIEVGGLPPSTHRRHADHGRLIREEERRLIARELHDSTSQYLVGMGLLLKNLRGMVDSREAGLLIDEIGSILKDTLNEIRSICYIFHPPVLDNGNIIDSLDMFVSEFSRRTGIDADLCCEVVDIDSLNSVEFSIYRIVQEALANVYRHANARQARVSLVSDGQEVTLTVEDNGRGLVGSSIQAHGVAGVGIASMRSRAVELGGSLDFLPTDVGTKLVATIPLNGGMVGRH